MRAFLPLRTSAALVVLAAGTGLAAASPPRFGAALVTGKLAPTLAGRSTSSIRAYAFHDGKAVAVPFQVDERDPKERWAIEGPSPVVDDSPGRFDDDDAVILLHRDLGERQPAASGTGLPGGAGHWVEVRVGSEKAPLGFVYVASLESPPPLDERDFCRYDAKTDTVFAERYTLRFAGPLPAHLAFVQRPGESGENVLAGMRAHGEARILRGLFHLERTERDIDATLHGWHDGPLRVVRTAKYWIRLPLGFKARGRVNLVFYPDFVEVQARVKIKIPPRLVPADGELAAWFDFRDFRRARVLAPGRDPTKPVADLSDEVRQQLAAPLLRWSALLLPNDGSFLLAVRLGGSLARLDQHLRLDASPGRPGFGFRLSGADRLDTGEQDIGVIAALLGTEDPSEVGAAGELALSPPPIAVKEIR